MAESTKKVIKMHPASIGVIGNAGAGKRSILGTLKFYMEDEAAIRATFEGGGVVHQRDRKHVLDNGIVSRDESRKKGTLKGASLPPYGMWTKEVLYTTTAQPIPSATTTTSDESHRGTAANIPEGKSSGLLESAYQHQLHNIEDDSDNDGDFDKTPSQLRDEARKKAKVEVEKRRRRIMDDGDYKKDQDVEQEEEDDAEDKNKRGDGNRKNTKESKRGGIDDNSNDDQVPPRYSFPLTITYGMPNSLAKVSDRDMRKYDGLVIVVDASTWDNDKANMKNVFRCFAFECKSWSTMSKVVLLTKCDKIVTARAKGKKDEQETKKSAEERQHQSASISELARISTELEDLLIDTKAMPDRRKIKQEHGDGKNIKSDGSNGCIPLNNGAIFQCSGETGLNVVKGFHHLAALVQGGGGGFGGGCCTVA